MSLSFFRSLTAATRLDFSDAAVTQKLPGADRGNVASPETGFSALLSQVLNIALVIGTIAVLFYLIWGGIEWITAGGDKSKTEKARDKITQAIVGLVVLISSVAILLFVQNLMGYCLINVGGTCASSSPPPAASCSQTCVPAPIECTENGGRLISGRCVSGYCCDLR